MSILRHGITVVRNLNTNISNTNLIPVDIIRLIQRSSLTVMAILQQCLFNFQLLL